MSFQQAQEFMRDRRIDAWLVHDFRGSNPVFSQLLPGKRHLTRRANLFIPAHGEPVILAHAIDELFFRSQPVRVEQYLTWRDYHAWLDRTLAGAGRVAMEYAPGCTLPVVSVIDAGTVELVRSKGAEVVSSADLIQVCVARWSAPAVEEHARTSAKTARIMEDAFGLIRSRIAGSAGVTELDVQRFIMERFAKENLETPDPPICAVNAHAGDPHFEVSQTAPGAIRAGDWVLIDLWARTPGDHNIFSDISWVGFAGRTPSDVQRRVWEGVRGARDASVRLAEERWKARRPVQGWELDEAARAVIIGAGFAHGIKHRTGHSLSPGERVHGIGVNIDNTETHDTRELLPGVGFTIEPGIYLPEFGARSEINVFIDPARGPVVTSCIQRDLVLLA